MNFPTWTTCANKWCVTRKLRQRQNQPSRSHLLSLWRDDWELSWQLYKNEEVVARYFKNGVNSRSGNVPIFEDEVPSNLVYDCVLPSHILVRTYLHLYLPLKVIHANRIKKDDISKNPLLKIADCKQWTFPKMSLKSR